MAVTLTGNGGIFKRIGLIAGGLADIKSILGGATTTAVASGASWLTRGGSLETEALNSPAVSAELDGHWATISNWRGSQSSIFSGMRGIAEKIINRQVDLDASLSSVDLTSALVELIRQMRASGDSVNASTVAAGAQTAVGSPTGEAVIVVSLKKWDGYIWQAPFAETLRFAATNDSLTGGTARNETMSVKGAAAISDKFAYNWPAGSGVSSSVSIVDAQSNNTRGNACTNSDFETATTTNYPDNWIIQTGAATTNFFVDTTPYTQTYSLKILGVGTDTPAIAQEFNKSTSTSAGAGGTPFQLKPQKQYAVQFRNKVSSVPAAGVLRCALVDSSGNVIADDSTASNSFNVTLSGLTTSWSSSSGTFRTPTVMPSDGIVRLQLKLTTAIDAAKSVYIDDLGFTEMTSLYRGGPSVAAFAGATNVVKGDTWTIAISNTLGKFARWMEILYLLNDKELIIPYSGSPTISDGLVV